MKLLIVESPNKCATIQKYLGKEYEVISCVGHFRDLKKGFGKGNGPTDKYGFNPETLEVKWDIKKDKKLISELKTKIEEAEHIYIATDPDREGEAIGWHLKEYFQIPEDKYNRIIFKAVRKDNIINAIENPGKLNKALYQAYLIRRLLDRMIGWDLSSFIQDKLHLKKYVDTAGRVQSVALWFVAEKEKKIKAFKPQEFYTIDAKLSFNNNDYEVKYPTSSADKVMMQEKEAKEFVSIMPDKMVVTNLSVKETKGKELLAFNTASLYRACYNSFGMTPKRVLSNAQELFQKGYISYHRTDSVRIEKPLEEKIASFVKGKYGDKYITPYVGNKLKADQDAHEAIVVLNLDLDPETFSTKESKSDLIKVYRTIYNRTLGCVVKPPIFEKTTVELEAATLKFNVKGSRIIFDGYIAITGQNPNDVILPEIKIGDEFIINSVKSTKNETKPPARYNASSLIKKLEDEKVGRPSTYSSMIEAVIADKKHYANVEEKRIFATDKGLEVSNVIAKNFADIISPSYTSKLEESLDQIANSETDYKTWWIQFKDNFFSTLEKANKSTQKKQLEKTGEKCPDCYADLVIKPSKNAHKYIICETKVHNNDACNFYEVKWEKSEQKCPNCNIAFEIKKNKRGQEFLACSNYPICQKTARTDGFIPTETGIFCGEDGCVGRIMNQKNKKTGELFESCEFWVRHLKSKRNSKKKRK